MLLNFLFSTFIGFAQENHKYVVLKGERTIEQMGFCKTSAKKTFVKLELKIDSKTMEIFGTEYSMDADEINYQKRPSIWTGRLFKSSIILTKQDTFNCSGGKKRVENLYFAKHFNACENDPNGICLELEEIYAMCPDSGCIFKTKYKLKVSAFK